MKRYSEKISVIVICFNQEFFIGKALDSLIIQTYPPDEIIVIDDNSTDQSVDIIKHHINSFSVPVKLIVNEENFGVTKNRNFGVELSSGDFVSFLDGDDYWAPSKLEKEFLVIQSIGKKIDIVFSGFILVDSKEQKLAEWKPDKDRKIDFERIYKRDFPLGILFRNELIRKKCFDQIKFDEKLDLYEDFDLRLGMGLKFTFRYCNNMGCYYRKTGKSLSDNNCRKHYSNLKYLYNKYNNTLGKINGKVLLQWKEEFLGNMLVNCLIREFSFMGKLLSVPAVMLNHPKYLPVLMKWRT